MVSYRFHTWCHTGFIPGFIAWFHTGFIPGRAIAIQCSGHSFVGCDNKGTNSLGDVAVLQWFHTGFIPGFIPVSYCVAPLPSNAAAIAL